MDFLQQMKLGLAYAAGGERGAMEAAGLLPGQIDAVEDLKERYPATQSLSSLQSVFTNPEYADLKADVLTMLEDEDLANEFGRQIQADPTLADRINHLVAHDPGKLRETVAGFRANPEGLSDTLKGLVSDQQAQEQATLAAAAPGGDMLSSLKEMFAGLGMGGILEFIGEFLLKLFQGRDALIENVGTALRDFSQSPEVMTAGNSNQPGGMLDGALNMMRDVLGTTPQALRETVDGVVSGISQPAPEAAPAAQPVAAPGINMVRPEMTGPARR